MHTDKSSGVTDLPWMVEELEPHLLAWERVYNPVRPHQVSNIGHRWGWSVVLQRRDKG